MDEELKTCFSSMQGLSIDLKSYQNEFETMRQICNPHSEKSSVTWLRELEENEYVEYSLKDDSDKVQESKSLRQEGNRLFSAKGDKRSILGACRLYTDAIYAALDTKGDELALGFANRAIALQTFGYYQQAYDDCVCALRLGYPELLRHKIITRQAYCSTKMRDLNRAEKHLSELQELNLSAGFSKELKELMEVSDELKRQMANKEDNSYATEVVPLNRETQKIITSKYGRSMQAKCDIKKNGLIFTERASAFVPTGDTRRMCHQCGTVNFIPIPCLHCRGRVNYCSLICQEGHFGIHMYECPAYRNQFFAHVGIGHLAVRTVLDNGLFSILDELKLTDNISTSEVWGKLTEGGDVWRNNNLTYAVSLRMVTHLNKMSHIHISFFSIVSCHLLVYLKYYTKYFDVLNAINKNIDWELLVGSLILRHIGQLISNGHTCVTIIPRSLTATHASCFHMLNENVWSSPWHVKLGCLHFFSYYDTVAALNLPYLSLCNHACVPSFQHKYSGRFMSAYALCDIKKGTEITNSYCLDYRKSKRVTRRERLLETYNFECQCENCLQTDNEDVEFNEFHQYRCDNSKCGQIFMPTTAEIFILNFWQCETSNAENLFCTICGHKQSLKWYHEGKQLLPITEAAYNRRRLYQIFKECEQYLVGLNEARCLLAQNLVLKWFKLSSLTNFTLTDQDYCDLIDMLKYILKVTGKQNSINSIPYVIEMIYLWDLMAKRKYKCSKADMGQMLWALTIISDDLKVIFLNYYNDYIKEYLNL